MRIDILTLFPDMFPGYLSQSILNRAIGRGLVEIYVHDMRRWASDRHQKMDDRPYGGGPGMVLMVEPVVRCVRDVQSLADEPGQLILLTPQGKTWSQPMVESMAVVPRLIMLCGRYEGFDQRVIDILEPVEVSIGDYILNGGEVAAMVVVDSLVRMVPGVLGDEHSNWDDSFSQGNRLLEYPQYTRPREFEGHRVPEILLSGDHQAIDDWRREQSFHRTKERREDLLDNRSADDPSDAGQTGQRE